MGTVPDYFPTDTSAHFPQRQVRTGYVSLR